MESVSITIYDFAELSETAKAKVLSDFRADDYFHEGDDIIKSLQAVCDFFGWTLKDFRLGGQGDYVTIEHSDEGEMSGARLWNWLNKHYSNAVRVADDCSLTGVCYDTDLMRPVVEFLKRPDNSTALDDLTRRVGSVAVGLYAQELEYWYSEESILDCIEANEYKFHASGNMYNPLA